MPRQVLAHAAAHLAVLQQLFLHARAQLPRETPHAVALAYAERFFAWLPTDFARTGWDEADHATIERAATKEWLGRVVRIPARVSSESRPLLVPMPARLFPGAKSKDPNATPKVDARRWTLGEPDEATIETMPIVTPQRFTSLRDPRARDLPHELLCVPMALPSVLSSDPSAKIDDRERSFTLAVLDVRPVTTALALIAATARERDAASKTLAKLKRNKTPPHRWLAREAKRRFRVAGEQMDDAIELCVLQALSHGMVGLDTARLHLLFVSAPGQGKGLLLAIARALALRSALVSPNDVTLPGLRGASRATPTGWTQRPGLYARSHRGVLAFPDAHAVAQRMVSPLMSSLHGVMDRGVIGQGTVGTRESRSLLAVCMDANRRQDVTERARAGRPRHLPLPELPSILSRMDGVIDLGEDDDRPWQTSEEILHTLEASDGGQADSPSDTRDLLVLIATLIDRHPVVDLGAQRGKLVAAQAAFKTYVLARRDTFPDHAFLANRIAVSRAKLAIALARGSDRSTLAPADRQESERLAWLKVHSIERMRERDAASTTDAPPVSAWDARRAWYLKTFGGKEASPAEIMQRYAREHDEPLAKVTLWRDLAVLGARRSAHGRYHIPRA